MAAEDYKHGCSQGLQSYPSNCLLRDLRPDASKVSNNHRCQPQPLHTTTMGSPQYARHNMRNLIAEYLSQAFHSLMNEVTSDGGLNGAMLE